MESNGEPYYCEKEEEMKKLSLVIATCLASFLAFAGVGLGESPAPYVLGFTPEITGRRAELGIANKRGAILALKKINAAGGINGRELKAVF